MAKGLNIYIKGDGIAARCCAHLLRRAGAKVLGDGVASARVPAMMLSPLAISLMRDVFTAPALFSNVFEIDRRYVTWGGTERIAIPHAAAVISERALLAAVPPPWDGDEQMTLDECDFTIHAALPLPGDKPRQRFGAREAATARVRLKGTAGRACEIESVADGWLFLIPTAEAAWLLAVGGPVETLLATSRQIGPRVEIEAGGGEFDCAPSIAEAVQGERWMACGPVAVGFDPICGDGTAHAVREAILAAAVIAGIARGEDRRALLSHYRAVLTLAMGRHLDLCADYYRSGGDSPWWRDQSDALSRGRAWCEARMQSAGPRMYRLQDFDLLPLTAGAA